MLCEMLESKHIMTVPFDKGFLVRRKDLCLGSLV